MAETYGTPKGNRSEGWRCMFGAAVSPFVSTPTFVLNSKYDFWQAGQIIGARLGRSRTRPPRRRFGMRASTPVRVRRFASGTARTHENAPKTRGPLLFSLWVTHMNYGFDAQSC